MPVNTKTKSARELAREHFPKSEVHGHFQCSRGKKTLHMYMFIYRGFQLLPWRVGPIFVNLLGRFYPSYMPGGVVLTISKLHFQNHYSQRAQGWYWVFDQICPNCSDFFEKRASTLLPDRNLSQNLNII